MIKIKRGSNGTKLNKLKPDNSIYGIMKYLNISISSDVSHAGMAEWLTQSVETRYLSGFVGSIPTVGGTILFDKKIKENQCDTGFVI